MKTFYCVQSMFFDNGQVRAISYPVYLDEKPKGNSFSIRQCDVYCDYFDTPEEAQAFLKDCERA